MIHRYAQLMPLIQQLEYYGITPMFVGGCVRDHLLDIQSHDIDIELYGVSDISALSDIVKPFGKINEVGKSFGVYKFRYEGYAIDLSLPRTENKSAKGHKGFEVQTYSDLDFATASRRRDFTINAMGYNPLTQKLLDPHNGTADLQNKILRCVDPQTFVEDPLRILRAVQFAARFDLICDSQLLNLCRAMIEKGALEELPIERIFEEIKKLLLSQKPSIGLDLLHQMGGGYLLGFTTSTPLQSTFQRCDKTALRRTGNVKTDLPLMLAALLLEIDNPQTILERINFHRAYATAALSIINYAKSYGILSPPPSPLLQGRDLIAMGLKPSQEFKTILASAYEAQLNEQFFTKQEAITWLKRTLVIAL